MNGQQSKSPLTSTEQVEITNSIQRKYAAFTGNRKFVLEGTADAQAVSLILTLKNDDESFFYPVEARMSYREEGLSQKAATGVLLDVMDSYFQEFLVNDGEVYLPIDWQEYESADGQKLQLRGQIRNMKLEKMADDLLSGGQATAGFGDA